MVRQRGGPGIPVGLVMICDGCGKDIFNPKSRVVLTVMAVGPGTQGGEKHPASRSYAFHKACRPAKVEVGALFKTPTPDR